MATYRENSCSFGLRYVSWYKCLIVSLVFSHLGFWSGNLFLIAPFPDLCLLVPFHGISLKETDSAKYLGVTITKDLSWSKHINQITTKANNYLNFIKRNIQTNNPKLKESAYKTYVRPLVEYAASVWDPEQNKYIEKIEMIQHRAIRYIFNDYSSSSSVTNMRSKLNLPTLKKRREISSLTMFYKIK